MSNYFNPVKVIQTDNWLFELKKNIEELKITKPFIVTSQGNKKRLVLNSIFNSKSIYSYVGSNPTFDDCNDIIKYCKEQSFDGLIAIGGGSPMDLAKVALAHISLGKTDVFQLIDYKNNYPNTIPSIFIPTTHGTGSEVTMWGTVWNMVEKKKYSISHIDLYPDVAILDGNLTLSLPLDISIITVMDALSHSFEAIWNKNANDFSTSFAIDAITMILDSINQFKKDPRNLDIRNKLMLASNKAGLAFSNTTTAAAHSISYPLTIHYGMPHGIASSISLLPLLDINRKHIKKHLDVICNYMGFTYNDLKERIKSIPQGIIPYTLDGWGIQKEQLSILAKKSFTKGRMENNIVQLSTFQIQSILMDIF
mgnify:FL=1|jgi:alcohol dehydrogenase class IV